MTALLRGKDVTGFPVVDLSTGEDIAEIRDLIFDPSRGGAWTASRWPERAVSAAGFKPGPGRREPCAPSAPTP